MSGKFYFSSIFLAFLMACGAGVLHASGDDIKVKAEVDKAFLTIGDPVTYTVTVEHGPDIQVLSRIPAPDSDILEIKKIEEIDRKEKKKSVTGRKFTLTTYKLGEFVLDPVTVRYKKEGQPEKTLQTNKIYLQVKSIAEGETKEDIRDVKSVIPLTKRFGWILIALGLLAAVFVIYIIFQKFRKKNGAFGIPEPVLTPAEEALKNLRELFDSDLLKRGFVKLYYLRLSEILRVYLEKRYGILAVESTTYEIMRALKGQELPKGLAEKIQEELSSADLAKFAKWVPSPAETTALNKRAEEIVLGSAPASTPAMTAGDSPRSEVPRGV